MDARTESPPAGPITLPIPEVTRQTGMSRATLYREAGKGTITFLKCGRSTLVDMASVRAFLAGLPKATIRAPREAA